MQLGNAIFVVGLLSLSLSAHAQFKFETPLMETLAGSKTDLLRCTQDQVITADDAKARADWAYRCNFLDPTVWEDEFTGEYDRRQKKYVKFPPHQRRYPIFVQNVDGFPIYHPDHSTCTLPDNVVFYDVCMNGCFKGDQRIAFEGGYEAIANASKKGAAASKVLTLSSDATLEQLKYQAQEIDYFVKNGRDAEETLVALKTNEGQLTVTRDHPVVDKEGYVVAADSLKVGDALVKSDGTLAIITDKSYEQYFGKVYNLSPASFDTQENVIVAEGFLNGSHRFQSGTLSDYKEVAVKRTVTID
jgi:hypothetical protein